MDTAAAAPALARASRSPGEVIVLGLSSLVALAIFLFTDATTLSDSASALSYPAGYRTPGYPIIAFLTGYPLHRSLIPLLAFQSVLAALMPWLIYRMFRPVSARLAFAAGLAAIATLLPYNEQTLIYPDQCQLFLLLLFCLALTRVVLWPGARWYVVLVATAVAMTLFRPSLATMVPIVAAVSIWLLVGPAALGARRWPLKIGLWGLAALIGLHVALNVYSATVESMRGIESQPFFGRQLFFNAYIHHPEVPGSFEDGAHLDELRETVVAYLRASDDPASGYPDLLTLRPQLADPSYEGRFDPDTNPPELVAERLLDEPGTHPYWALEQITEVYLGAAGDRLMLDVAVEQYLAHPALLAAVLESGIRNFTWGYECRAGPPTSPLRCVFYPAYADLFPETAATMPEGDWRGIGSLLRPALGEAATTAIVGPFAWYAGTVWPTFYRWLLPALTVTVATGLAALVFLAGFRRLRPARSTAIVLVAACVVFAAEMLPMALLVNAQYRYQAAGALPLFVAAAASLHLGWHLIAGRRNRTTRTGEPK